QKNRRTATPTTSNVIYKVAGQFAQDALVQEQKMRTQKDIEDREKLVQLQQEAVRRQQQKEIAEENLRKHRQS
ncbi:MAG: hypothetical protein IKJ01_09150, partial [Lachnospiraceae bacterium]|nr:hypothetical protein [Lachnospiraceae bacterium]